MTSLKSVLLSNTTPCSILLKLNWPYAMTSPEFNVFTWNLVSNLSIAKSLIAIGYKFWFSKKFSCSIVNGWTMSLSFWILKSCADGLTVISDPSSQLNCVQYKYSLIITFQLSSIAFSILSNTIPLRSNHAP